MIGIIIPVYNEGTVIGRTLDEVETKIHTEHKIYIVFDFDEDTTLPVVRLWSDQHRREVVLVRNYFGGGALNAIRTGFMAATTEFVLVVMADMSDDLACVEAMYQMMLSGYDVVCGSRYMKGGRQIGGPVLKRTMSRFAGLSLHWFIHIPTHDVTNSFKMYRKSLLDEIVIESTGGFELGMEITVKGFVMGRRVGEVPSTWYDRTQGDSRFRLWAWLPSYLKWYVFAIASKKVKGRTTMEGSS